MSWFEFEILKIADFKLKFYPSDIGRMKKVCIIGGGPAGIMVAGALQGRIRNF